MSEPELEPDDEFDFIPKDEKEFVIWMNNFIEKLTPLREQLNISEEEFALLKNEADDFQALIIKADEAEKAAKKAAAAKHQSLIEFETEAQRVKALPGYTRSLGLELGIEGPEFELNTAKPDLCAIDLTGGKVELSYPKLMGDGLNIYCRHENDEEWLLIGCATQSSFIDNRPLTAGKAETRYYIGIHVQNDCELGHYSEVAEVHCTP